MSDLATQTDNNSTQRGATIVVYITGVLTIIIGLVGLLFPNTVPGESALAWTYWLTLVLGILDVVFAYFYLVAAEYLTCGVLILLSSLGLATSTNDTAPILGYIVAIALAGVLIGGNTIPIVGGAATIAFIIVLYTNNEIASRLSVPVVLGATAVIVLLLTIFSASQRRTAANAQQNAAQLALKNAELEAAFVNERQAKDEALTLAATLSAASSQQKSSAETAATAISQVTAQSAELSATAAQIATAAHLIRDVGDRTRDMATDARGRLDSDREQLNQAVRAGEQLQEAARGVTDKVKQMSQILNLITEVAEETHMLSLNATIEATGTGEAGRRFRIIAAEVGNLANKVNSSTEQVASIVQNVQRTAQQMLTTANQTVDSIRRSQMASAATGEQIEQVSEAAGEVAREGFLIGSSTEQQRRASELIADAMQQVSSLARQTADNSTQLEGIASQLTQSVDRLAAGIPLSVTPTQPPANSNGSSANGHTSNPTTKLNTADSI